MEKEYRRQRFAKKALGISDYIAVQHINLQAPRLDFTLMILLPFNIPNRVNTQFQSIIRRKRIAAQ